jgi:hypothetical protein
MKIQPLIVATTIAALFTGCAGTSPTRIVGNTISVAGGALLGSTLGKRNPLVTAAGAGAGLLLSESLHAGSTAAANKSYAAGYEKGRSDSAKQQYHTLIEQQRQPAGFTEEPATLFDIPLPEREVGGAILKPSTRTLRIQE